jgi:hypothetical protein
MESNIHDQTLRYHDQGITGFHISTTEHSLLEQKQATYRSSSRGFMCFNSNCRIWSPRHNGVGLSSSVGGILYAKPVLWKCDMCIQSSSKFRDTQSVRTDTVAPITCISLQLAHPPTTNPPSSAEPGPLLYYRRTCIQRYSIARRQLSNP